MKAHGALLPVTPELARERPVHGVPFGMDLPAIDLRSGDTILTDAAGQPVGLVRTLSAGDRTVLSALFPGKFPPPPEVRLDPHS